MPEISRCPSIARDASLPCVGNWQTVSILGRGRWSRVYRARPRDASPDAPADYAIKLADPADPADDDTARELLLREAILGRAVSHPHLICILSSHLNVAPYYLVMPYLEGSTLETLMEPSGPLPTPLALWIIRQAAEASRTLHSHGWLHGDVKPSNLFVTSDGHVTLLDLGLARRIGSPEPRDSWSLGGTLAYLPPEAFSSVIELGPPADVYALGVTLYQMLTARLPFEAEQPSELAEAHLHQVPEDPRQFNSRLSREVAQLVANLLAKQPDRRPVIEQLIKDLIQLEIATFDQRFAA